MDHIGLVDHAPKVCVASRHRDPVAVRVKNQAGTLAWLTSGRVV